MRSLGLAGASRRQDGATCNAQTPRKPILYLRGFDEDRARLPARFTRRGILQWLSPIRRTGFEEVLVRALQPYGPVVAVSPPGTRLGSLGAAKLSLANGSWQVDVAELAREALCVVVGATPTTVNPGLAWELEYLGRHPDLPLVLVRGPWRPTEVARRWSAFSNAAAALGGTQSLAELEVPPGVQVISRSGMAPWLCVGSRRWTDWSYVASVREGLDFALRLGDEHAQKATS